MIDNILKQQKQFFESGATLPAKFRIEMLKRLYNAIKENQDKIAEALSSDLGKSEYESFMCEIGLTLTEISYMIKHTKKFAKERRVYTPLSQFPSKSYIKPVPYGNTLIMSPWNYPFLLTMEPLADAISAGNTAVLKPSAYSPATSEVIGDIIRECFDPEYVAVITGGRKENAQLLNHKFDFIFFTGSQGVGKEVLRHTAENLTPVVLELGGKSPCIVDSTAKIDLSAKRIVFGKYLNCGQTCVAPDYILCHESIKDEFIKAVCKEIKRQYGDNPLEDSNYGKIINEKHFNRIMGLIDKEKTIYGGDADADKLKIAPTVMDNVSYDDAVMQEEIFGPVMPILTYNNIDEVKRAILSGQKPLALYIFSQDRAVIKKLTSEVAYGGGCVNDTVIHLATSHLPFGGVGESGMGNYHGKMGFDAFSHNKSILNKKTWLDLPMRYQPYNSKINRKLLKMFLK